MSTRLENKATCRNLAAQGMTSSAISAKLGLPWRSVVGHLAPTAREEQTAFSRQRALERAQARAGRAKLAAVGRAARMDKAARARLSAKQRAALSHAWAVARALANDPLLL